MSYEFQAAAGIQRIDEHASPYDPTQIGKGTRTLFIPAESPYTGALTTGPNYNLSARIEYQAAHVVFTLFGAANNARHYNSRTVGITLRLPFQRVPSTPGLRPKTVPDWRGTP